MLDSYSKYRHLFQAFAAVAACFLESGKTHNCVCHIIYYLTGNVKTPAHIDGTVKLFETGEISSSSITTVGSLPGSL